LRVFLEAKETAVGTRRVRPAGDRKREHLEYRGRYYSIPLPDGHGSVLGKPLKLINHPVREGIPVPLAALGPKNVERAAALAEGWQPIFFLPERAESV
jgi:alkanesulfonate monooxygenase SsuD/methylene tetrahydromethanopterin reductase-like flavin-dependent oxidoreductase (luciferase family)